jgi:hypothetical protein
MSEKMSKRKSIPVEKPQNEPIKGSHKSVEESTEEKPQGGLIEASQSSAQWRCLT